MKSLAPSERAAWAKSIKARDTKLGRSVAIKVLPPAFVEDRERLARFEREARVLASLNHPNIATIYGLEQSNSTQYLVMELVPGQTLAERLKAGPLETAEALAMAGQIAAALESAHEQGVVHRDLKPANIEVTPDGRVKVLDFGLAKALAGEGDGYRDSSLAQAAVSQTGILLGTPAYMSPEQVRGKAVDKRADIWAFGCVLYEMLSGQRLFTGESITDVLAEVLTREPDWATLPKTTPASIQRLIRRCLVKEPKQRLRDIGEARIAIEEAQTGKADTEADLSSMQSDAWRRAVPWEIVTAILVCALVAYFLLRPKKAGDVVRFSVLPPENTRFYSYNSFLSVSPDGRKLAFEIGGGAQGPHTLSIRALDSLSAESLYAPPGYLFYVTGGRLMAQTFDDGSLRSTGQPVPISEGVGLNRGLDYGLGYFSVSQRGVLAYQSAPSGPISQMTWFNRKDEKLGTVGEPGVFLTPALSPDETKIAAPSGSYVAYQSHESGRYEIYVQTFPDHRGKWQISTSGGMEPTWRRDRKELFYLTPEDRLMAVEINTAAGQFQAGIPKELFRTPVVAGLFWRNRYVVSADGQRFLMLSPAGGNESNPITVVLNWPALLEGK